LNQVNHHSRHRSSSGQQQQPTSSERKDHRSSSSSSRRQDPSKSNDKTSTIPSSSSPSSIPDTSIFSSLFQQRAQGFRMDFAFRNAPPRPPVGPCFMGRGLDGQLQELANYRPHNAVEVNHLWKLHAESDLGVPLAPSAMNLRMYEKQPSATTATTTTIATTTTTLHPDDEALLLWKGHLGDSAMELLQKAKDTKRATARLALAGKTVPDISSSTPNFTKKKKGGDKKKEFSRVLDHGMVFFMKKTTYLSNDHTRKVHDFKSLAETKKRVAEDLSTQQRQFDRSPRTIERSFEKTTTQSSFVHPSGDTTKKIVWEAPLLPNVEYWGHTFTHVVMDTIPPKLQTPDDLEYAYIAHVEQSTMNSKMTCQLLLPQNKEDLTSSNDYISTAQYDLDVVPLKDNENVANTHYCIWISSNDDNNDITATYMPIPSRVQLSTGRPGTKKNTVTNIRKQDDDVVEWDEEYYQRMAQVDYDVSTTRPTKKGIIRGHVKEEMTTNQMTRFGMLDDNDDEEDDDEDDEDDDAQHKNRKNTLDDNDDDDEDDE
jgi:hypothetical protein